MSKELSAEEFFKEIIPLLKQEVNRFYDNWVQSHTTKPQKEEHGNQTSTITVPYNSKPTEERIEVRAVYYDTNLPSGLIKYYFTLTREFEKEKYPAIKQAIEQVLNDDRPFMTDAEMIHALNKKKYHVIHDIQFQADKKKEEQRNEIEIIKGKAYTQEEVDKIEEMAFLSSRNGINSNNIEGAQYPTYKDYKQTLKK